MSGNGMELHHGGVRRPETLEGVVWQLQVVKQPLREQESDLDAAKS